MIPKKTFGLLLSLVILLGGLGFFAVSPRWVYGYVRDAETGEALAGVPVTIGQQSTVADGEGYFQMGSIRGLSMVHASAEGYHPASVSLAVANLVGARREIVLSLKPIELRGTVTDADTRQPIAAAIVRVGEREVQTDEHGRYSVKRLTPGGQIVARATYYRPSDPVDYDGQGVQNVALSLLPVTVTVRDELTGEPLPGATLKAADQTVQSDAQGRVVFARLEPQTEVVGILGGYKEGRCTVNPGDEATLNLRPPIIKGTVRNPEGQPLSGALVLLRAPGREPRLVYTDAQGHYLLPGVVDGGTLRVRLAGYKHAEQPAVSDEDVDFTLEPFVAKGLYVQFGLLFPESAGQLQSILDLVDRTELNTVVIDVKSDKGWLAFEPKHPVARELDAKHDGIVDLRQVLEECKRRNIYTIARMVIFKDDVLAEGRPEWAVRNGRGGLWRDDIGNAYTDMFRQEVWEYNVALAVEAAELGFDEIQFDYIRFPSDGNIFDTYYSKEESRQARTEAINGYVAYARQELDKTGVFFSLDVFGLTTSINLDLKYGDLGIGQHLAELAPLADYISPMIYPSTYIPGNLGLRDPQRSPYEVVKISVEDGRNRAGQTLLRPWLQHYSLGGVQFGAAEFLLEKQAAVEAGAHGWLFWNANGEYEASVFDPE